MSHDRLKLTYYGNDLHSLKFAEDIELQVLHFRLTLDLFGTEIFWRNLLSLSLMSSSSLFCKEVLELYN
uniref:Phosphoinositide phosphatase SAC8-like n=1 Tax=Rhizophora mucronata TaxID=61149 RepID=A0A2P2LJ65_RHIMU